MPATRPTTIQQRQEIRRLAESGMSGEGIAREVRNATTAEWDEEHMFRCLAWLYDGFALPAEGEEIQQRAQAGSRL